MRIAAAPSVTFDQPMIRPGVAYRARMSGAADAAPAAAATSSTNDRSSGRPAERAGRSPGRKRQGQGRTPSGRARASGASAVGEQAADDDEQAKAAASA